VNFGSGQTPAALARTTATSSGAPDTRPRSGSGWRQGRSCLQGELRRDPVAAARRGDSDRLGTRSSALRCRRSPSRGRDEHFGARRVMLLPLRRRGLPGAGLLADRGIPVARWQHRRDAALTGAERSSWTIAPLTRPPVAMVAAGRVNCSDEEQPLKGNKAQRKDRACRTGNGANTLRTRRRSKASKSASEARIRVDEGTWQRVSRERGEA
jgi:hypothetical protein